MNSEERQKVGHLLIAIYEFNGDWKKGDFNIPALAQHDFASIMEKAKDLALLMENMEKSEQ